MGGYYLSYIDGLRALAVLAVIIFHFSPQSMPGGYLGVDVFFTISGYVVLKSMLERKRDSIKGIYASFLARRVKRLLPAVVFCFLVTSFVVFIFVPKSAATLDFSLKTGIAAVFGLSNLFLIRESTHYFSQDADLNFFTHTWSLGVEEQFYLLFPLFLIFAYSKGSGIRKNFLFYALLLASLFSFFFTLFLYKSSPTQTFYLMPSRFWQLGLGCLTYLVQARGASAGKLLSSDLFLAFVLLILGSAFFLPKDGGLLPSIIASSCCAFLLYGLARADRLKEFFSFFVLTKIGVLSYSLYLWHWPIAVLRRWTVGEGALSFLFCVVFLFVAAFFSYRFIENRFRYFSYKVSDKKFLGYAFLGAFFSAALVRGGTPYFTRLYQGEATFAASYKCTSLENPDILLVGDSHSKAILPLVSRVTSGECHFPSGDAGALFTSRFGDFSSELLKRTRDVFVQGDERLLGLVEKTKPKAVFLAYYWQGYFAPLSDSYPSADWVAGSFFSKKGVALDYKAAFLAIMGTLSSVIEKSPQTKFILLLPTPDFNWVSSGGPPRHLCDREWFRPRPENLPECRLYHKKVAVSLGQVEKRRAFIKEGLTRMAALYENAAVYDPLAALCSEKVCATKDARGRVMYRDDDHINGLSAQKMEKGFSRLLDGLLGADRAKKGGASAAAYEVR